VTGTSKFLVTLAVMMVVVVASGTATSDTNGFSDTTDTQDSNNTPDLLQIRSDLVGSFMYVGGASPGFWSISSPEVIRNGTIRSTRRNADLLEISYTAILVDDKIQQGDLYRAETLVTYQQVNGDWEFLKVQGKSIERTESNDVDC